MKRELVKQLFEEFEEACYSLDGLECWSARELQKILSYRDWRNFTKSIERAMKACINSGEQVEDHFVGVNKMVSIGSGTEREIGDVALTRYGCYLIAQNSDPGKPTVAFAQTYFAIQTRKQELIALRLKDISRLQAREKLSRSERKLSGIIFDRGVNPRSFSLLRSEGDKALFGGSATRKMKQQLGVPTNRPLADFLPTLLIKAKDFETELTIHNVVDKNILGDQKIISEHFDNNHEVRKILLKRGVKPEKLPRAEDVKKVKSRIDNTEKKILNEFKSGNPNNAKGNRKR